MVQKKVNKADEQVMAQPLPQWQEARTFEDVLYHKAEGIARITINRPHVHNAFRPQTTFELMAAFQDAKEDPDIGVVILTGAGDKAFCSGGDQRVRGDAGYVGSDGVPRLNVLELQRFILRSAHAREPSGVLEIDKDRTFGLHLLEGMRADGRGVGVRVVTEWHDTDSHAPQAKAGKVGGGPAVSERLLGHGVGK